MLEHSGVEAGPEHRRAWLPSGVIAREPQPGPHPSTLVPGRRGARSATRIRTALADAPAGVIAVTRESSLYGLIVADPAAEFIDFEALSPGDDVEQGPPAACVLDDLLEVVEHPSALLEDAWHRLQPGGLLVLRVGDVERRSRRRSDTTARRSLPLEPLSRLLFHAGFEAPRFYPSGREVVVTARRTVSAPPWARRHRLSVIVPVFNEQGTFAKTMDLLLDKDIPDLDMEIIVVESNSTDGTREEVLGYAGVEGVRVILEDAPRGKGHAVRRGLEAATGDFLLIQDADLEYDLDDYETLLEPLRRFEASFVLGMRTSPDGSWGMRRFGQNTTMSHIMNVGHVLFLGLFNLVYGQRLRDPFTMYKVFRRDCLEGLTFECNRFDFDWELTAKLIRAGYTPIELPVSYRSRSFTEGKKVTLFRDPLTWIWACFKHRFSKLYSYL